MLKFQEIKQSLTIENKELKSMNKFLIQKNILKLFILLFILFSNINNSYSQGGSNYSLFGIGELNRNKGAFYDGLSGTAISVPSEYAINLQNPAMWSYVESTRLQFGYKFNQHYNESSTQSLFQNNGKLNDVLAIFSIDTAMGISASLGLYSHSTVNYFISNPTSKTADGITVNGTTQYQGEGGITNVFLGVSARPTDYLALGVSVTGHLGNIKNTSNTTYFESFTFRSATYRENSFGGLSTKLGFNLTAIEDFSIGGFVNINNNFSYKNTNEFITQFAIDTVTNIEQTITLPTEIGLGVAYKTGKFILASDFVTQDFTNLDFNKNTASTFQNSYKLSFGARRVGNPQRSADFLDRLGYNFGIAYSQLYYNVNNTNLNEVSGSFGLNIPIPGTGVIDIATIIGQRGTIDNGLINEYFGRLIINMSIGDTWFKPIRRYFD